jgi:hypothetical protein
MLFLVVNFQNFASVKKDYQHQQMIFNHNFLKTFNDIIQQWVLRLIAKIYKYFNRLYLHIHSL